ncbi:MAG: outer membrane protein transport protein [Sulfurimonas sp.]|nr:outer membrane protein transport protein [Sulfurimonas sp.]
MKNTIKLAVVAALALGATSAFATNGDVMIGQGAKSRAMGGVGIAKSFGAESGLVNPANISSVEKSEATLVITAFAPNVSFDGPTQMGSTGYQDSSANFSVIPEIAYATRLTDRAVVGLSMSGTAGMGTDYDSKTGTSNNGSARMKTALSLLKVAVPVSYTVGGFTAGIAGVLQYGSLQLSHQYGAGFANFRNNGASTDIGYGLEIGAAYTTGGLTLGAVYKSKIGMTYDNTIGQSLVDFGVSGAITSGDNLDQPEERGVGISYSMGANTISADYKNIAWGDAAGYADFGWENQDVYAVGYEYAADSFAVRLGYNYAKSPIVEQADTYVGGVTNFFNLSGFPGIVETHYTVGGGYNISDALSLDGSFIYVPEATASYNTTTFTTAVGGTGTSSANVKHSQMALTIAGTYKF